MRECSRALNRSAAHPTRQRRALTVLGAALESGLDMLSNGVARSRRASSGHLFAEVTILVDGSTSVADAHDFTDEVERAISREVGTAEAIVHVEPA